MNRLAGETSPYLLQHAHNPVDWFPWGAAALARSREEDKPILLSIGYSACHWCHVMERESFEDPETASLMNERFVCIKLDREERPDIDAIYMEACVAMTGQGGWPLNARAYLHGWQVTGDGLFREICCATLDWALREMRAPEGGFFSALDADSEGEEGKFYVWTLDELREVAGDDAAGWFGASERGNFEGRNILVRGSDDDPDPLDEWRRKLYERRSERVWPGLDDKRLSSWNALMVSVLAEAGAVLTRADYLDAARACAEFLLRELRDESGRLLRTYKDGRARLNGYLEDHSYLLEALLALYESSFEPRWFGEARTLADAMIERFADEERGGFFDTSSDHERLLARRKDLEDHPIPAGNSSAAYGPLRLAALTGELEYEQRAVGVLRLLHELAPKHPQAFGHLLQALDFHLMPTREVALVGGDWSAFERVVRSR